jgi:hypothetical protein
MYPRWIEKRVRDELSDTRVVLLAGPRQAGKTILAKKVAEERATFLTLDDPTVLNAAKDDPGGSVVEQRTQAIDQNAEDPFPGFRTSGGAAGSFAQAHCG